MSKGIRGLKSVGSDGHGIPWLSGDICPIPGIVALFIGGCVLCGVPVWALLTANITPMLWDEYAANLFVALFGVMIILFSMRLFRIRNQMKSLRTMRQLARWMGVSQDELVERLESADFWPVVNVNGTYYWNVSKSSLTELLLRAAEKPPLAQGPFEICDRDWQ